MNYLLTEVILVFHFYRIADWIYIYEELNLLMFDRERLLN